MKTKGKAWQLVVTVLLIAAFVYTAFFGVAVKYGDVTKTYIKGAQDIRFGVDIKGGVNVTFGPSDGYDATDDQLDAAQLVIENRLVALNVTDYELYVDYDSDRLILEFPWQSGETDFDPEAAIEEIGTTAYLTFREGSSADGELILDGSMVESAAAQYGPVNGSSSEYYVALKFTDEGAKAFGDATTKLYQSSGTISIWLDDENVSTASVNAAITDGSAIITSSAANPFTQEDVVKMARQINSGSLPFALTVDSYSTISPSLGENSLSAMVLAGLIAFALIVVLMTVLYRLPGFLACIALAGQVAATLAFVSGYFSVFESFTLTLPGIAGIILAIGMGVDANVITAERIKEELRSGKSLDGALKSGFARGLTPIIDGNVTIVIVAIVLMGAFGPSDGFFAKALHFVFFAFGPSTAGTIYAFGYTLLTGVLLNFVFGVFATRVMIRGAAAIKALRNPWLYGADKPGKEPAAEKKPINFVALRKRFLTFSACLMAAILLCAVVFGVRLDTEFAGGAMITLSYEGEFTTSEVQKTASAALGSNDLTLQSGENVATGEQTLKISMPGNETVTTDQVENLLDSLNETYPDNAFAQLSLSNVSAAMGTKFLQKSLVAVVFALILILLYIGIRFKKIGGLTGGMMAVLALLNDLMVVFGTFVLLRTPLDGNFIAAMLTILGYSINDTVVVYDRIRENRALMGKKTSFEELVNHSVNQSARRTLITTITTVMALGVMCVISKLYGLDSIFTFAFPLMMGMVSGVYTSLCVSTSAWVLWSERKGKKNA